MKQNTAGHTYELIAKRCPSCESLIMARILEVSPGIEKYYNDFRCSSCNWENTLARPGTVKD